MQMSCSTGEILIKSISVCQSSVINVMLDGIDLVSPTKMLFKFAPFACCSDLPWALIACPVFIMSESVTAKVFKQHGSMAHILLKMVVNYLLIIILK